METNQLSSIACEGINSVTGIPFSRIYGDYLHETLEEDQYKLIELEIDGVRATLYQGFVDSFSDSPKGDLVLNKNLAYRVDHCINYFSMPDRQEYYSKGTNIDSLSSSWVAFVDYYKSSMKVTISEDGDEYEIYPFYDSN